MGKLYPAITDKKDICFYGDSLIWCGKWQEWFPDENICNLGCGGDGVADLLRRIPMLVSVQPRKVFILFGINDFGYTLEEWATSYALLIDKIKKELPTTDIYLHSILPIHHSRYADYCTNESIREKNRAIENLSRKKNVKYIDIFSLYLNIKGEISYEQTRDGVHLKEEKYEIWKNEIKQYVVS